MDWPGKGSDPVQGLGKAWLLGLALVALLLWALLGGLNLYWADLNQDEGWYLYAADLVIAGEVPYRDFAFTQGPLLPYIYAPARAVLAEGGLAAMRGFTLLLALPVLFLAAATAARLAPARLSGLAAITAFLLLAVNVYHSQFTALVKTYSLTTLFVACGLPAFAMATDRERPVAGMLAGFFLAAAAATRLSAGFLLAGLCLHTLAHPRLRTTRAWFYLGIGGAIGLAFVFLPFFVLAPEGFLFGLFQYHAGRSAGSLGAALVYKAGFLSRFAGAYFVAAGLALGLLLLRLLQPGARPNDERPAHPGIGALWTAAAAATLVHLAAPFPYDDYQVIVFPFIAVALGAGLAHSLHRLSPAPPPGAQDPVLPWARWTALLLLLASTGAAFSSPLNQDWFVRGRDRIWWELKEQSPIRHLQHVGADLRDRTQPGDEILTQDVYLAVEARRRVPRGMELGPFSYFPDMDPLRAATLHVLNEESLLALLAESPAPVAAFSGYGLAIRSPQIEPVQEWEARRLRRALEGRFRLVEEVPHFGQAHTTLRIYERID